MFTARAYNPYKGGRRNEPRKKDLAQMTYYLAPTAVLVEQAEAALASGFASEARRKEAQSKLSSAFSKVRDAFTNKLLADFPRDEDGNRPSPFEELYWGVPNDLHLWRPKVAAIFAAYPEFVAEADALADLRAAIKAAPVEPKPIPEDHPLVVFAKTANVDLAAIREKRMGDYQVALDLGRKLNGLPVSVHRAFCQNYGGTTWVRLDWFLRGRRVAFSVVAAAYDQLVREGTIIPEKA